MTRQPSRFKIVVSPDVPHDIIDNTFEGALIRRMVGVMRTSDGYELSSNDGVTTALANPKELVDLAKQSDSRYAQAALPMVAKSAGLGEPFFLDDYSDALDIEQLSLEHVLQELCRLYPERFDHFSVTWSETGKGATPEFATTGGGGAFVTADEIKMISTRDWLEDMKAMFERDKGYRPSDLWSKVDGKDIWRVLIPHSNFEDIATDEPHSFFEVSRIEITSSGKEFKVKNSQIPGSPLFYADMEEAFREAERLHLSTVVGCNDAIVRSLDLDPAEWRFFGEGELVLSRRDDPQITMIYDAENASWNLYNRGDHLGTDEEPDELADLLKEAEAEFRR